MWLLDWGSNFRNHRRQELSLMLYSWSNSFDSNIVREAGKLVVLINEELGLE